MPIVIPSGESLSQWYEMWSGGGCQRRCDGRINVLRDSPCECPSDPLDRADLASKGRACKPTTRLNVVLADVPGIGVWRLESHGYHSAVELPMVAEFLAQATEAGTYLPAELALTPRSSKRPGQGKREWLVPIIDVKTTPRALMAGDIPGIGGSRAAIGNDRKALEASKPDYVALANAAQSLEEWREVWNQAGTAGHLDGTLKDLLAPIGQALRDGAQQPVEEPVLGEENGVAYAEIVGDTEELDRLWALILENAGDMDYKQLEREFAARTNGLHPQSANAAQLQAFLTHLQNTVAAGVPR